MRKTLMLVAAACLFALPAAAGETRGAQSTDFSSQGVYIEGPGVGLRVGPNRRYRERDRMRNRGFREREVRRGGCKTITVRETRPDGTRVTRTRERC